MCVCVCVALLCYVMSYYAMHRICEAKQERRDVVTGGDGYVPACRLPDYLFIYLFTCIEMIFLLIPSFFHPIGSTLRRRDRRTTPSRRGIMTIPIPIQRTVIIGVAL